MPSALACSGSCAPTSRIWNGRVGAKDVVDDDGVGAVHDADAHRGLRAHREPLRVHDRARAQLVDVEVGVAELQQAGAELVLLGVAILLDESLGQQRLQQPVHRGPREAEPIGELADPEPPGPPASALRMRAARSTDWIVSAPAIRHC